MKKLLYLLIIFISLGAKAQDIYTIRGTVNDEKGAVIPGATVFITNSKYTTATDNEGKFSFSNIGSGNYEVVIKMLGYNPAIQGITVRQRSVKIIAILQESITELNTVVINGGPDPNRGRYMDMFTRSFIGETINSQKCKLLNPQVLKFNYNKDTKILQASATDFLIIENRALGYKLKYLLTEFTLEERKSVCSYNGHPYFEELSGTPSEQKKWEENRKIAYLSSDRHFFKALVNNTLKQEGYQVYLITDLMKTTNDLKFKGYTVRQDYVVFAPGIRLMPKKMVTAIKLEDTDSLFITGNTNFKTIISTPKIFTSKQAIEKDTISLKGLYVVYTGEKEEPLFYHTGIPADLFPFINLGKQSRHRQISQLISLTDTVTADSNGRLTSAKGFESSNYWGWLRIADLTPFDYVVEPVQTATDEPINIKNPVLKHAISAIDSLRNQLPVEKLYLQVDKPYYTLGDTLRFKAYLLNAGLTASLRSGMLYVELDDMAGRMVKRIMVPLASGVSWGDIALNEKQDIAEGSYTLRAYTNWMRNFGEDYVFKKNIYVSALSGATLVNANFKLDSAAGKNNVKALMRFARLDKDALRFADFRLKVKAGRKTLFRDKVTTGIDGGIDINFDLKDSVAVKDLSIEVQNITKGADTATLTIPVTINRPEKTDVQFMPEGGNMVAGIPTKIGFKAIGENGRGQQVSGKILNSKQQEITTFKTTYKGMGTFELTPQPGESYTARVALPGNSMKNYPLPAVTATGTALKINATDDSLEITLSASPNLAGLPSASYYLIGQARQKVWYAAAVYFKQAVLKLTVAKDLFPTGIVRFTLLSNSDQPLNERIVFINHNDNLQLNLVTSQPAYTIRDSIALNLQVTDTGGIPVQGTFSVAVTDDSQVKADTLGSNMLNQLLLASDLKGTIEEPGYYFENNTPARIAALDNLLLTQGWVGYNWGQVFGPKISPKYAAEKEFTIHGKLTNVLNKPLKQTAISLLQKQPFLAKDTITNDEGEFLFKGIFPADSAFYYLQARDKKGDAKDFNVGVQVDEFIAPVFTAAKQKILPWYVNSDSLLLNNNGTRLAQLKAESNYRGEGNVLKEVVIKDKRIIKDSHNLNGPGESDFSMDEKDMNNSKHMTLFELLKKKYKNDFVLEPFTFSVRSKSMMMSYHIEHYLLFRRMVSLVIDGIPYGKTGLPMDVFMNNLMAEDIRGVEIMYNPKYIMAYDPAIVHKFNTMNDKLVPTYLEITTYSGHGAFLKNKPGRYIYKPIGFSLPKDFYRPRYTITNSNLAMGTDLRSTIHWEPNLVTDTTGKATLSFFSADKPGDYTILIEGTDLNGNIGYRRQKIKITAKTTTAAK